MTGRRPGPPSTPAEPSDVVGLRAVADGVHVSLRCRGCGQVFERYQPTLAGLAFGRHPCPRCQAVLVIGPAEFEAALDRFLPPESLDETVRFTESANRITQNWYWAAPLAEVLTYRGVNLGQPTERELLSFISVALQAARAGQRGSQ